jgi:hypothetical protein
LLALDRFLARHGRIVPELNDRGKVVIGTTPATKCGALSQPPAHTLCDFACQRP